jgi:LmbE family N-acetylglucosaminyl deacetylase
MRRLIVAPHMDDESLGCGGLLAKRPAECQVLVVTDSGEQRAVEHAHAMAILGLGESTRLGYEDGEVPARMTALVADLDAELARLRPDEIYLPFPSLHQDHIAVYEAGMRACRTSMSPDHWVPNGVYVYDIAVYDVNLYPSDLRWNVFEALTEEQADLKVAACEAYETEHPQGPHPMSSVKQHLAAVGHVRKVEYAEQYALVKMVRP